MILEDDLIIAISEACSKAGGQVAFAKLTGVKRQNISRYLNKEVKEITPKVMARLWPHVREFLPKDFYLPHDFSLSTNAEILADHLKEKPESNYAVYHFMTKALFDIGADQLFFYIMTVWFGLSDEQKKKLYVEVNKIAEDN